MSSCKMPSNDTITIVIQASSRSWSGGKDNCMSLFNSKPIIQHTIDHIIANSPQNINVIIAAPAFDKDNQELQILANNYPANLVTVFYGDSQNPLRRLVMATSHLHGTDYIIRINGINFCCDVHAAFSNLALAVQNGDDCIRFQDDFPALFTSDIYRVGALREALSDIDGKLLEFHVHPKYYMASNDKFHTHVYRPIREDYPDTLLYESRRKYQLAIHEDRVDVDSKNAIPEADTIDFHYKMAKAYLSKSATVVDLACGSGFGTRTLATTVAKIIGLDLDFTILKSTNCKHNFSFACANALTMPFKDCSIDAIVAFEILEHLSPRVLLKEIFRVLRPGGILCLSTPQNCLGHIPITAAHTREFSLDELKVLIKDFFSIKELVGIKQGTIYFPGDEIGSNTFVVAAKLAANCLRRVQ